LALIASCWSIAFTMLLRQRPWLRLDGQALRIRRVGYTVSLAWDDVVVSPGPIRLDQGVTRYLTIYRKLSPDGATLLRERVPVGTLHVDPAFLASAIREYAEHPQRRAAIGSADELTRIEAAYAVRTAGRP
ncbi:MAG TPA: hypothetical protein VF163_07215, partial [Micromonosporaceae bacterium]